MIVCLTPNPALDLTYDVATLRPHGEHRVTTVHQRPGGKGINVASVLAQLGDCSVLTGPIGGLDGDHVRQLLDADEAMTSGLVRQRWTPIDGATRRTVTVIDDGGATAFNEPGPTLSASEQRCLLDDVQQAAKDNAQAVVISGSLPGGLGAEAVAELVSHLRRDGLPVVADSSGDALLAAARAGADIVKPNRDELRAVTGNDNPVTGARVLLDAGASAVACSLGADGMVLLVGDGTAWRARPPEQLRGNPTGAGDAAVAALVRGLAHSTGWVEVLRDAVATSAAAVACPVAGRIDTSLRNRFLSLVEIEDITWR